MNKTPQKYKQKNQQVVSKVIRRYYPFVHLLGAALDGEIHINSDTNKNSPTSRKTKLIPPISRQGISRQGQPQMTADFSGLNKQGALEQGLIWAV